MVLMLIAGSTILGHFLAVTKIPILTADWVAGYLKPLCHHDSDQPDLSVGVHS